MPSSSFPLSLFFSNHRSHSQSRVSLLLQTISFVIFCGIFYLYVLNTKFFPDIAHDEMIYNEGNLMEKQRTNKNHIYKKNNIKEEKKREKENIILDPGIVKDNIDNDDEEEANIEDTIALETDDNNDDGDNGDHDENNTVQKRLELEQQEIQHTPMYIGVNQETVCYKQKWLKNYLQVIEEMQSGKRAKKFLVYKPNCGYCGLCNRLNGILGSFFMAVLLDRWFIIDWKWKERHYTEKDTTYLEPRLFDWRASTAVGTKYFPYENEDQGEDQDESLTTKKQMNTKVMRGWGDKDMLRDVLKNMDLTPLNSYTNIILDWIGDSVIKALRYNPDAIQLAQEKGFIEKEEDNNVENPKPKENLLDKKWQEDFKGCAIRILFQPSEKLKNYYCHVQKMEYNRRGIDDDTRQFNTIQNDDGSGLRVGNEHKKVFFSPGIGIHVRTGDDPSYNIGNARPKAEHLLFGKCARGINEALLHDEKFHPQQYLNIETEFFSDSIKVDTINTIRSNSNLFFDPMINRRGVDITTWHVASDREDVVNELSTQYPLQTMSLPSNFEIVAYQVCLNNIKRLKEEKQSFLLLTNMQNNDDIVNWNSSLLSTLQTSTPLTKSKWIKEYDRKLQKYELENQSRNSKLDSVRKHSAGAPDEQFALGPLLDLLLLSSGVAVIGSCGSTFSSSAARFGLIPTTFTISKRTMFESRYFNGRCQCYDMPPDLDIQEVITDYNPNLLPFFMNATTSSSSSSTGLTFETQNRKGKRNDNTNYDPKTILHKNRAEKLCRARIVGKGEEYYHLYEDPIWDERYNPSRKENRDEIIQDINFDNENMNDDTDQIDRQKLLLDLLATPPFITCPVN